MRASLSIYFKPRKAFVSPSYELRLVPPPLSESCDEDRRLPEGLEAYSRTRSMCFPVAVSIFSRVASRAL